MAEVQLIVSLDTGSGAMGVAGSPEVMGNQVLALGMLESAKIALVQHAKDQERRVQPATALPQGLSLVKP